MRGASDSHDPGADAPPTPRGAPSTARRCMAPLTLAALIIGTGCLASATTTTGALAPPLWPPAGLALAGLLVCGLRVWPGVWIGMTVLAALGGGDLPTVATLAAAWAVQPLLAWLLLTRVVRFHSAMPRPSDLGWLILIGVLGSPLVGAGAAVLVASWQTAPPAIAVLFVQRWAAGAAGILAFTPLLLAWKAAEDAPRDSRSAWIEFAVAMLLLGLLLLEAPTLLPGLPLESLAFPVLITLGLRHGVRVAATGVTLLCVLLVATLAAGGGPLHVFEADEQLMGLLGLWAFALTAGGTALLAAILGDEIRRRRNREGSDRAVRELLDSSPGMTWVTDGRGACVFASRSWRDFTGLSLDEHRERGWAGQVVEADRAALELAWEAAREGLTTFAHEHRSVRADGEERWLLSSARVREDREGRVVGHVGTCVDITDRKQYEILARRSERLASVGTLAAGIAHEINNPVASILLAAQVARRRTEDGQLDTLLGRIEDDAERAGRVTRRVLQFARSDPLERQPLDLVPIIRTSLELAGSEALRAGTVLRATLPDALPLVSASAGDMEQVLVNLVLNAIQAEARTVECRASARGASVRLCVEDDGRGPTVDALEHAFDPFFTTRGGTGGTGLGLSVSHGIIEAHEGRITLEARSGGGARVNIELPCVDAAPLAEA